MKRLSPARVIRRILFSLNNIFAKKAEQPHLFEELTIAYLGNIYMLPEYRAKGVGGMLVEKGLEWVRRMNVGRIFLQVHEANQAGLEFREKAGFQHNKHIMVRKV